MAKKKEIKGRLEGTVDKIGNTAQSVKTCVCNCKEWAKEHPKTSKTVVIICGVLAAVSLGYLLGKGKNK